MADGLTALGEGLQGAGAILSSEVYQTQAHERQNALTNIARTLEITKAKRQLDADTKFSEFTKGLQPNAMTSEGLLDVAKKVPVDVLAESPRAQQFLQITSQVQAREAATDARKEAVNARYMQIEQMAETARDRAANTALSIQERAAADKRHNALQAELLRIREESAKANIEIRRLEAGKKEDIRLDKMNAPVEDLIADIDQAIRMIQQNPGVTGARGMGTRLYELGKSTLTSDTNTPANDFQSQLLQIQSKWRKLPTVAANRFKSDASKIDASIKGLGIGSNDAITINNLTQLRENLARGLEARGGTAPQGAETAQPTGPKKGDTANSKSGRAMTFDGEKWVYD